jgi:hypothetical protein
MKLNQFEKSISFIHNNLPGYIRKLYETFLVLEGEFYAQLKKAYETNPYSVNSYIRSFSSSLFVSPQFLQLCKYIMSEENQFKLQSYLLQLNKKDNNTDNYLEDTFITLMGGDLFAPLNVIEGFISSFPFNHSYTERLPIMCIEPYNLKRNYQSVNNGNYIKNKLNKDNFFWNLDIYNETGDISLFDSLGSKLKIDIDHVFTYFFRSLYLYYAGKLNYNEVKPWELYESFHYTLTSNDPEILNAHNIIIHDYTRHVTGSAILTYMTYAGKLLGSKENMLNWLYSTFVKETVSDIEAGEYQKNADITAFSGHQSSLDYTNGDGYPEANNYINKREIDTQKKIQRQIPDTAIAWNPNIIYKHLRLNYSNWCSVINTITSLSAREKRENTLYYKDNISKKINTDLSSHLDMANTILEEYISHYFATYNIYVFPTAEKAGLTDAGYFIKFTSSRIMEASIKDIIVKSCYDIFSNPKGEVTENQPFDTSSFFIKPPSYTISYFFTSGEDQKGILHSIKLVKNFLADVFMTYTYIIMLNGLFSNQGVILDEQDALTGRPKKELFNEIYTTLVNKINNTLFYSCDYRYKDIVLYTGKTINLTEWLSGIFTQYNINLEKIFEPANNYFHLTTSKIIVDNNDIQQIRTALKKVTSLITINDSKNIPPSMNDYINIEDCIELLTELYDIHPISVILELSKYYKVRVTVPLSGDPVSEVTQNTTYTRSGSLFPRNRVTNEIINNVRVYEPKLFTSLESASSILEKAKEDAILGNNANYSFLGGIGGSVTEEENTVNKFNENNIPSDNTVQFGSKESSNDLDTMVTNTKLNNLISSWNELFNKMVLKNKEIKIA